MKQKDKKTNENKAIRVVLQGKEVAVSVGLEDGKKLLADKDYARRTIMIIDQFYVLLRKIHKELGEENQNYEWTVMQAFNDLEEDSPLKQAIEENRIEIFTGMVETVVEFEKHYSFEALKSKYFTKEEKRDRLKMLRNKRMNLSLEDISKETEIPIEDLKKLIEEN